MLYINSSLFKMFPSSEHVRSKDDRKNNFYTVQYLEVDPNKGG